jgi:putative colanic acid biosynthesis UDP-glucose lipid carrier transferase
MSLLNSGQTSVLGLPALDISVSPMVGFNVIVKWFEDKCLSVAIILLISPVLLIIAAAIKLTSKGPVIFKQKRHGWNGKIITIFKFRTMYYSTESDGVKQATIADTRVTPLGAFLRRTSLDELPQFFNVLFGDMSIVGPRPHAVEHNQEYMQRIDSYMLRHKVKPGVTGWAQVNGLRGETDTVDKMIARVDHDLYYIENWSLWFDLSIIAKTIVTGFINKNAY